MTNLFKSRDDSRIERHLEAARKAGIAAPLKDEAGNDINPHIPQYISKAPWYLNHSAPSLKHQRHQEAEKTDLESWHRRGVTSQVAIKYRKGACENCGALTHDAKSCVERPRKKGAKFTNSDICPDEYIVQDNAKGYEAVRDRWAGFDPESHLALVDEYQQVEQERQKRILAKMAQANIEDDVNENNASNVNGAKPTQGQSIKDLADDVEGVKVGEFNDVDAAFGTRDDRTRTTTRNLRIREDTAKYLINLNPESARYDPKSRCMRDDPLIGLENPSEKHDFHGDNAYFACEDVSKPKELELFAWEAYKRGANVHSIAKPTQLEFLYKQHLEKKQKFQEKRREKLVEQYGGDECLERAQELEHLVKPSSDAAATTPSENSKSSVQLHSQVETTRKQTNEAAEIELGHRQIWGSYFNMQESKWGYKCCKSTNRNDKCTVQQQ